MLKEGEHQYIEAIGIHRGTKKSSLCNKFVNHFLSSEAQKMVIYKLGMFLLTERHFYRCIFLLFLLLPTV